MENNSTKRILFFGSGDFPVRTFTELIASGHKISGLVTSRDKIYFESKRLSDIADSNGIPVCVPESTDDPDFLNWIDEHPADIFCVISYKFLSRNVTAKATLAAFNVHASLLPFLRGANPICWAIMNEFTETGLTAFVLDDKIDTGDILDNERVKMNSEDDYGSLYEKLASACPAFTMRVIDGLSSGWYVTRIKQQSTAAFSEDRRLFVAPKVNSSFTAMPEQPTKARELVRLIKAISPRWALHVPVNVYSVGENREKTLVKAFEMNVYEAEVKTLKRDFINEKSRVIHTDFKTDMYFFEGKFEEDAVFIKKVQIPGKKILSIEEFLRGLQYLDKTGIQIMIEPKPEK